MKMSNVEIRNLKKSYDKNDVMENVNLSISSKEFVVLVGPSGCGKSTLLRMIAGLESISGGEIAVGDRVVNDIPARDRHIAMVFQNYALYPHKSVYQNMAFSLKLQKMPKPEIERRVRSAAEILSLEPLLDRKPSQLSGGQRQRVAMGRAIVRETNVFLFDEPLSNLDAKLRVQMRTEIRALHQRLGCTTIYVTHDQIEAMTMADRIVVMNGGAIEQVGTPDDLYDCPANLFVASFIGSPAMNMLEVDLVRTEAGQTEARHGDMRMPVTLATNASPPRTAVFGIRPEHVELTEAGDVAEANAVVETVELTGPERLVAVDYAGTRLFGLIDKQKTWRPGQKVKVAFAEGKAHLFDKTTSTRLN
jgi:multiple sugar transport system ATP-binding protein